jgi:hypothetical protein
MSDRDFFREVDEAVRQDRYKELWDKYGLYALVVAALIVASVGGFKAWAYWQERKSQEAGTEFSLALGQLDGGDAAKANTALGDLAEKGPAGYRMLARFQLAAAEAHAGNTDKAVALYDALAADPGTDGILNGLAAIQAATLRLDTADYAEMEGRLNGLIEQGSPWKYSARELLGLSAYRSNKIADAERQFSTLIADQATPQNLRERADMMLALIVGKPQALSTTAK